VPLIDRLGAIAHLKHETFCCSDRGSAGAKRDPLQGRLRGAVQQADDMRSRRAYHESPVTFCVCLSVLVLRLSAIPRANALHRRFEYGENGYRWLFASTDGPKACSSFRRTFEQSQGKVV
jgi:hypothetical protein